MKHHLSRRMSHDNVYIDKYIRLICIKRLIYATKEKEEKVDSRVDELLKKSAESPQKLT